jgi:multidrug efflux pump subunit AcrA (membrane-fusion protein)
MPNINKPVVKFYVNRGDHVKQGQLVATLESRDLKAAVANAQAQVSQATTNLHSIQQVALPEAAVKAQTDMQSDQQQLDAAQKLLDNRAKLFEQGALAAKLVDDARVAYASAKAQMEAATEHLRVLNSAGKQDQIATAQQQLEAANAQLAAAEAQIGYAEIKSPLTGVVADRPTYEGEMAVPGTPLLTVMDISRVVARTNIPVNQGGSVKIGQDAEIVPVEGGDTVPGKVTVVSPATDPASTTMQVWVEADNRTEKLKPGASAHVRIITELVKNATTVPVAALLPGEEGGEAVLVIDSESIAHKHTVTVGIREGDKAQILNGARPGDEVVVVGGLGVDDKAKVRKVDTTVQESDDEDNGPDAAPADKPKDQKKDEAQPKAK